MVVIALAEVMFAQSDKPTECLRTWVPQALQ
ncbi:hypothetical protein X772_34475 [Mesorhizobium sp. LSJC280B00]|nr:hypothetical protein X772_34475 [Mesorhizobium sp. LSJC280B00]